jgi:hypothetical protein
MSSLQSNQSVGNLVCQIRVTRASLHHTHSAACVGDQVDWEYISRCQVLSEAFMREFADRVDWTSISYENTLSEAFIREFADRVDWDRISYEKTLSEPFIREFADRVDWNSISYEKTLSEPFIREFADRVDWTSISYETTLSEALIREFAERVDWYDISIRNRVLKKEFIREFKPRLTMCANVKNLIEKSHAASTLTLALPSELSLTIVSFL